MTFTNLAKGFLSSTLVRMKAREDVEVAYDQDIHERLYCRLKGLHRLTGLPKNSHIMKSVDNTIKELKKVNHKL